jgi:cobalt-zinc-cadmium resistance protein CzcA
VIIALAILALGWGAISFHNLRGSYPDIADNYATVITRRPGRAAEEVEQQVTIPMKFR